VATLFSKYIAVHVTATNVFLKIACMHAAFASTEKVTWSIA